MEQKIKSLIENLLEKTKSKETNWERIGKGDQFVLFLDTAKISLDKLVTTNEILTYRFSIININGENILSIKGVKDQNAPFSINTSFQDGEIKNYPILKNLHEEIKKYYFKVDETIEGLLDEVLKPGEIGNEDHDSSSFPK